MTPSGRAIVQITPDPSDTWFRLDLVIVRGGETLSSTHEHSDCAALTRAAVLALAVHLDPVAVAGQLPAAPPQPVTPAPQPQPVTPIQPVAPSDVIAPPTSPPPAEPSATYHAPPAATAPTPAASSEDERGEDRRGKHGTRGALRVFGGLGYGVMPNFGANVGLGFAIIRPRFRLDLQGATWAANGREHPRQPRGVR